MNKVVKWVAIVSTGLCIGMIMLFVLYLSASGTLAWIFSGPKIVAEQPSPDERYIAYVVDYPSLDGPNQSLQVERADKTRCLCLAKLTGDVDSIKKILWSPDGSFVVYHSHLYLTAARLSDWRTVRVYLGDEWRRAEPSRRSTFSGAMPKLFVEEISFPEAGSFAYRLKGENAVRVVKMID